MFFSWTAEPRAVDGAVDDREDLVGKGQRLLARFAVDVGDLQQDRFDGVLAQVRGHRLGHARVDEHAVEPAQDGDHHQDIGEGVHVPAHLEAGMQGGDDDKRGAEVDVTREPALDIAAGAAILALANAEPHQPQDQ